MAVNVIYMKQKLKSFLFYSIYIVMNDLYTIETLASDEITICKVLSQLWI